MNKDLVKLTFVGDIMCDHEQLDNLKLEDGYGFDSIFEDLKKYFRESDYVVGNLETPVAGKEAKYSFEKYRMNAPIEFIETIKKSGIKLVSTANNHSLDRGVIGLKNTVKNLDKIKLDHVGTYLNSSDKHYLIKNISGLKVAFLSYSYGTNAFDNNHYLKKSERYCIDLFQNQELSGLVNRIVFSNSDKKVIGIAKTFIKKIDSPRFSKQVYEVEENNKHWLRQLRRDIKACKKQADVVVMLAHIGGQYNAEPSIYTKQVTNWLAKNGVDMVICNHEHVIHPIKLRGGVVAYALGNFFGAGGVISEPFNKNSEYSLIFHAYIDKVKKETVKYAFSICKTVQDTDGRLKNVLVYDLIGQSSGVKKKKLIEDYTSIVEKVTGLKDRHLQIMKEYPLSYNI